MRTNENPGALAGATGARMPNQETAEGTRTIARSPRKTKAGTPYRITPSAGGDPFRIVVCGRDRWALDQLRKAGAKGCTPINNPAPRWSAYVFNLRELGVPIDTIHEPHGGEFSGTHARYVLRGQATPDWKGGAA
ncbi:winged helix domain-containing protein [Tropicimonas aquimaris]|uniref:Winged helix domain-containing protein n=1 Tax=Tropicimonas aquimaris TaxID=914152 RepID=A0ABW3IJR5_9RHOB